MSNTNIWFIIPTFSLSNTVWQCRRKLFLATQFSVLVQMLLSWIIAALWNYFSPNVKQLWKVNMSNELTMGYHMDYNIFLSISNPSVNYVNILTI